MSVRNSGTPEKQKFWQAVTAGSISDAVISTDLKFNITGWNRAAETIYGWRAGEVLGRPLAQVLKTHLLYDSRENAVKQLFEQGKWRGEVTHERRDGASILILTSMYLARNGAGTPIGSVSVNIDITERRRAEEEIRRRTAHSEALLRVAARLNARLDLDAVLNTVCKEAATALNVPSAVLALHDEASDELYFAADFGLPTGFLPRFRPIPRATYDEFTRQYGHIFVAQDWQGLSHQQNGHLYAGLDVHTVGGATIQMADGTFVGFLSLFVYHEERTFSTDELNLVRGLADLAAQAIHNARLFTAYKRSEDDLRQARDRLHHLLVSSPVAIYSLEAGGDFAMNFIAGSKAALLGYGEREVEDPGFLAQHLHPDDREQFFADMYRVVHQGHHSQEYRFLHKDGTYRWMHTEGRLVRNDQHAPAEIIGSWLDITRRKQAEDETRRQTARAEALVRIASRLNNVFDLQPLLQTICEETARALRVPATFVTLYDEKLEAFGPAATFGLPPDFRDRYRPIPRAQFEEPARRTERMIQVWDAEAIQGLPHRELFQALDARTAGVAYMLRGDEVVGSLNIFTFHEPRQLSQGELTLWRGLADQAAQAITNVRLMADRKRAEAQLLVTDRLASLGTLAAGMAHEINNPLAYVVTNLEVVGEGLTALRQQDNTIVNLADLKRALSDAVDGVKRIGSIVRDLKTFSRGDEERQSPIDVREVLEVSMRMVINEMRHRARLVRAFHEVPPVRANESRLGQVFVNLLLNAGQAFAAEDPEHNEIRLTTRATHRHVIVEVRDNGIGIPKEMIEHIFDPFFTTKPTGTGLGLSICHSIVKTLGGELTVESTPGKGSTFRVVLPALRTAPRVEVQPAAPLPAARRGRIMVVDDEPMIVKSLQRKLSGDHEVATFTDARKALARLAAGERFEVILCDLMMPEMSGMDFFAEIGRVAPDQAARVVFLTGGAFTPRARAFLDAVANRHLEKPLTDNTLQRLLREMLS